LGYWYGAVCIAGLGFDLLGERRPFGQNILAHPFIVYAFVLAAALLVVRVVQAAGARAHPGTRAWFRVCRGPSSLPGTSSPRI